MPALLAVAERAKGSLLLVFVERLIPLPSPRCPFAVLTIEFIGDQNKRAIDYGTVVVRQVRDPSFDTQPSELDQMFGSCPSLDLPVAHVGACLDGFKPVPRRCQLGERCPARA